MRARVEGYRIAAASVVADQRESRFEPGNGSPRCTGALLLCSRPRRRVLPRTPSHRSAAAYSHWAPTPSKLTDDQKARVVAEPRARRERAGERGRIACALAGWRRWLRPQALR